MFRLNWVCDNKNFKKSNLCASLKKYPLGFVDAGAAGDAFSFILPVASLTHSIYFEPNHKAAEALRQKYKLNKMFSKLTIVESAIGRKRCQQKLNVTESPVNSSLLKPRSDLIDRYGAFGFSVKENIFVNTDSLDRLLFKTKALGEFIKLDCQGMEYEILKGAQEVLREHCMALVCEVEFFEMYKDQKLFAEVDLFLRKNGFYLYGLYPHYISTKKLDRKEYDSQERLLYADTLYFKDPLEYANRKRRFSKRNIEVLILCAILTHYYDYALELLAYFPRETSDAEYLPTLIVEMAFLDRKLIEDDFHKFSEDSRKMPQKKYLLAKKFIDMHTSNNNIDFIKL